MTTPVTATAVARAGDDLLFVSGLTSRDADGRVVGEDIVAQTHQVLARLGTILTQAGSSMAEVVKITTFVRDADDIATVSAIRRDYFTGPAPAATSVEVSRLFDRRHLLEIDVVATISRPAEGRTE